MKRVKQLFIKKLVALWMGGSNPSPIQAGSITLSSVLNPGGCAVAITKYPPKSQRGFHKRPSLQLTDSHWEGLEMAVSFYRLPARRFKLCFEFKNTGNQQISSRSYAQISRFLSISFWVPRYYHLKSCNTCVTSRHLRVKLIWVPNLSFLISKYF